MHEREPLPEQSHDQQEADHSRVEVADAPPSIWIGSLLDYNNGILHGDWIDATREEADIHAGIRRILAASPTARMQGEVAEEWGIFDSDGFGLAHIGEYESIELVANLARGIAEHGAAYGAYYSLTDSAEELDDFEDAYLGHWDSVDAYAEQLIDDLGYDELLDRAVPESLRPYVQIDTEQLARDMQYEGSLLSVEDPAGGVWLFHAR